MTAAPRNDHTTWMVRPYSWRAAHRLADALGVPLVAAMVLCARGLTDPEEARVFLDCVFPLPDPFLFAGMEGAVATIGSAIDEQRRIVVHGDYDADGITATALLVTGLREFGADPEWFLPNRFEEGFGLSRKAVEAIAATGASVLVAVDCGVNYPEEVALARRLGLEVVVIDHHQPGPVLPDCHLIHPVAGKYPHDDLCGVGLALKVMHGLYVRRLNAARDRLPVQLERSLDLVAIGTIADLASLRGENRYYVKEGLKLIEIGQRPGLRALVAVSGCTGPVDSGTVAYRLAPRLNAAGRLADPVPPLRLLLAEDESEAARLAAQLHELNGARQDVERQIFSEAVLRVDAMEVLPPVIVLAAEGWHEGVVGIVASRLVERYNRPSVLLGMRESVAKGSGRSIAGYDLLSGLTACEGLLTVYGGHTQAVGLTLDVGRVEEFREGLERHAAGVLGNRDLSPVYRADAVLRGEDVNTDTALALAALGPFGSENPRPRLLLVGASLLDCETTRNGNHLRCAVGVDGVRVRGIGFGLGDHAAEAHPVSGERVLGVQFRVDEWRGTLRPEFFIERIGAGTNGDRPAITGPGGTGAAVASGGSNRVTAPASRAGTSAGRGSEAVASPEGKLGAARLLLRTADDRRDREGRLSSLAQVLATRESAVLMTCSIDHTLPTLERRLPLDALEAGTIRLTGRAYQPCSAGLSWSEGRWMAEWDAPQEAVDSASPPAHMVVLDPPYRERHVALLRGMEKRGTVVHLFYGPAERVATAALLRYLVHPRFAMVCLYRALQATTDAEDVSARAAALGLEEAGVTLTQADLTRAHSILEALGVGRERPGEAKLEARTVAAYAQAEAEYEECVRLCQSL